MTTTTRSGLRELPAKWRKAAAALDAAELRSVADMARAECYRSRADELEAALTSREAGEGEWDGEAVAWLHKNGRSLLLDDGMHHATNPADWEPLIRPPAPSQAAADGDAETHTHFIDGIGWVVPCRHAAAYVRKVLAAAPVAAAQPAEGVVDENARLRDALSDLLSWFPDKPSPPEWRIEAGERGADDAVAAARAALHPASGGSNEG